jgi:UDP-glucose 4-epimerase
MNRRVLVTGGAGFIGSHVIDALLAAGDIPHALDDLSKGQVTNLPDGVPLHVADISTTPLDRLFAGQRFDAVVHCAAQTNVMRSLADPDLDARINIDGLARVLEASVTHGVSRFVFISSGGAIYGETPAAATEATEPRPDNPYGWHKLKGESIVAESPLSSVSLRLSNVYGPRQRSDSEGGVISIFTERIAAGQPLHVYGDGEQQRDFVHVSDVVAAIMLALDDASLTGCWNVATGSPTSVNDLIATLRPAFGDLDVRYEPARHEIRRSCIDASKLLGTGRWRPRTPLADGLLALARSLAAT